MSDNVVEVKSFKVLPIKELSANIKKVNKEDIKEVDKVQWEITRNQLLALKALELSDEELRTYMSENIKMEDVYKKEVLQEMITDEIDKLVNEGVDISNKGISSVISIDGETFDRVIEFNVTEMIDIGGLKENDDTLPEFNDMIKSQIETICTTLLEGYLDGDELQTFIERRCFEYSEEPYTIDYLEGLIEGYLLRCDEEDEDDDI